MIFILRSDFVKHLFFHDALDNGAANGFFGKSWWNPAVQPGQSAVTAAHGLPSTALGQLWITAPEAAWTRPCSDKEAGKERWSEAETEKTHW